MLSCSPMNSIDYICSTSRDLCQTLLDPEPLHEWFGGQVVKVAEVLDSLVKEVRPGQPLTALHAPITVLNVGRKHFLGVLYVALVILPCLKKKMTVHVGLVSNKHKNSIILKFVHVNPNSRLFCDTVN